MLRTSAALLTACLGLVACMRCSPAPNSADDGGVADSAVDSVAGPDTATAETQETPADTEPSGWAPLPLGEECEIVVGDVEKLKLSPPTWASCGPGCLVTEGAAFGYKRMARGASSAAFVDGELLLRRVLDNGITGGASRQQVLRIGDGTTLGIVEQRGTGCVAIGNGPSVPSAMAYWHAKRGLLAATASVAGVTFSKKWHTAPSLAATFFAYRDGVGWGFADGTVRSLAPVTADTLTLLDAAEGRPDWAVGRKDLVVWPHATPTGYEVRGWHVGTPSGSTYVPPQDVVPSVTLSETRLVWVRARGPDAALGKYSDATLYWSPLPKSPADVVVTTGPALGAAGGLGDVQSSGDFAAAVGVNAEAKPRLFVVQISTKRVWSLAGASKDVLTGALAVSDAELLVSATDAPGTFSQEVRRLYRFRLDRLDELAATW